MVLATHAVAGAALASVMPSYPVAGFMVGFMSHFVLDSIPHWDYKILSNSIDPKSTDRKLSFNKNMALDMLRIGSDGLLGLVLAYLFFFDSASPWVFIAGAIGAMLPDPLQFVYTRFPKGPIVYLQRFHEWIHATKHLKGRPVVGIATQIILCALFIFAVKGLTF